MASYEQRFYCKSCKKTVKPDSKGRCPKCEQASFNRSWSVRFWLDNGSQKRLNGYATKKEAQDAFFKFQKEQELKKDVQPEKLRFDRLYEEYKNFTKSRIKETSFYDFNQKCELRVFPFFKEMYVQNITPKILLKWQNSISSFSFEYKQNLRGYLMSILNYAEKYYQIPNQLRHTDNFRNTEPKKEMQVWSPEEFNKFIQQVDKLEFKAFFYALYYTGARKGEILATTWKDWDLQKGILNINKSLSRKVVGTSWVITTPKNHSSVRKISLPTPLIKIMEELKKNAPQGQFVFYGNKPLSGTSAERIRNKACEKAGVKVIRLHDFRHSHASLLLSQGVSVVAVAKRLGHSNIEQTLNTYAHLMPQEDLALLNVLNAC